MSNLMKIRAMGAELFHPSGRTDTTNKYSLCAVLRTHLKGTVSKSEEEKQVGDDNGRQLLIYQAHDICNSRFDWKC